MHKNDRYRLILNEVERRPVSTPAYLAELLGVSEATVRRDLIALDNQGRLKRLRGGVEAIRPPATIPLIGRPLEHSKTINVAAKNTIAKAAAELIEEGDSIIIAAGSTTLMLAEHIREKYFHVMTNSFAIAQYLLGHSKCSVNVPSGKIYRDQNLILSPFDSDGRKHFFASKIFLSAQAVNEVGIMESDPQISRSVASLIPQAKQVILLADSSKFNTSKNIIVCTLDTFDKVITNDDIDEDTIQWIENAGCCLIRVPVAPNRDWSDYEKTQGENHV